MSSRFNKVLGAGLIAGLIVAAGMVGQSLAGEVADAYPWTPEAASDQAGIRIVGYDQAGNVGYDYSENFVVQAATAGDDSGLADSPWPMRGHDVRHTGRSIYKGIEWPFLKWRYQTGGAVSCPAIGSDGTVYVGSHDNYLYAIKPVVTLL